MIKKEDIPFFTKFHKVCTVDRNSVEALVSTLRKSLKGNELKSLEKTEACIGGSLAGRSRHINMSFISKLFDESLCAGDFNLSVILLMMRFLNASTPVEALSGAPLQIIHMLKQEVEANFNEHMKRLAS